MRRLSLALFFAFATCLCLSACGSQSRARDSVPLTLVEGGGAAPISAPAWDLPRSGRVVALGGTPGDVLVAQRLRLSQLNADGSVETVLEPSSGGSIVGLSRHGGRIAISGAEGIYAGRVDSVDPDSTALSGSEGPHHPIVFDGYPARIFDSRLWDLNIPRMTWLPQAYGTIAALDPRQRRIGIGDEEGKVTLVSVKTGEPEGSVPDPARPPSGLALAALAISAGGGVSSLDEAGWLSCGGGSVPSLPPAPPGMPAAVTLAENGFWALRGGIAVFTDCASGSPRPVCELRGAEGDPRSAALLAVRGRVYAAGLRRGRIVLLPHCR